jgi:hypothetical protein
LTRVQPFKATPSTGERALKPEKDERELVFYRPRASRLNLRL